MVFRRSCFRCGSLDHMAAACPSETEVCFNCKQPGHRSNECTSERDVSLQQCFNCGGTGHVRTDCTEPVKPKPARTLNKNNNRTGPRPQGRQFKPKDQSQKAENGAEGDDKVEDLANKLEQATLSEDGTSAGKPRKHESKCFNCGTTGHVARDCTEAPQEQSGEGEDGARSGRKHFVNRRIVKCFNCGAPGHYIAECRFEEKPTCHICGKLGHLSKFCRTRFSQHKVSCYNCGESGHINRDCPTAEEGKTCYQCRTAGHVAKDCPNAPPAEETTEAVEAEATTA